MNDTATIDDTIAAAEADTADTPAPVLRAFARGEGVPVGTRGRIHPDVKALWAKASKTKRAKYLKTA